MGILNKVSCYIRSRRIKNTDDFYKAINNHREEVDRVEVRGSITQIEDGFLGEFQDYHSYLKFCASKEGKPYLKFREYIGRHATVLGLNAERKGAPLIDSNLESIEKRILELAKSHGCENLTKVMFAEQIGA